VILGVLSWLVANAAAILGAGAILRRIQTGTDVDWPVFLAVRLTLISCTVLLAGLLGCLSPYALGLAGLVALIILLVTRAHRPWPSLPRIEAGRVALFFAVIVAARLLWQVVSFSPHVVDALTYHLPKIAEWVRAGRFTREMGADVRASFPAGFELVETWWVVFFHHDALIEMAGVEFLLLTFVATRSLARSLGLGARAAFFAGLISIMTPGLHLQSTSCLNDGPVAALFLTETAFIAARLSIPFLIWIAGLGVGIKPTFAYALPGLALLWILTRRDARPTTSRTSTPLALAGVGVVLGAFWYVRNALWYGNPIHPMEAGGVLGPTGRPSQQLGPSLDAFAQNVRCLLDIRIADRGAPYGSMLDGIAGWGPAAVACGLPALVLALRDDPRWRRLALSFAISMASVFLLVSLDRWYLRFALFVPALLGLAAARLTETMKTALPICAAALLLEFGGTFIPKEMADRPRLPSALKLARGEPVACFGDTEGLAYLLYEADYSRPLIYLRAGSALELIERARASPARVTLATPVLRRDWEILQQAVASGALRPLDRPFFLVSR
jgi:hypothetical protein